MSVQLHFVTPPFGLGPLSAFTLSELDGGRGLFSLVANREPAIRLFLVDAAAYVGGYAPELSDDQVASVQVSSPEDALLLVVVTPADDAVTVNLRAPIVVNANTGAAAQVIVQDGDWPVRARLAARAA